MTGKADHEHGEHHEHSAHSQGVHHHHGDRLLDTPPSVSPIERGHGRDKLLFFECSSGIAGDMTIAAFVDLGVPFSIIEALPKKLGLEGCSVRHLGAERSGIVASRIDVVVEQEQPPRTYASIDAMLQESSLEQDVKALARAIFLRLGQAESVAHRIPLEQVHFHEVGAVDAIIDVVGAASCAAYLGAEIWSSPLPMTRGRVQASHGPLPLPAPATVHCLEGVPTYGDPIEAELVTPTGAAIVATLATRFVDWPEFQPMHVGYGSGTRTLSDRPNFLRAILGTPNGEARSATTHVLLEANIDDMTGELAGHAIDTLIEAGALDAWASPITMKKSRPAFTLSVLAPADRAIALADKILAETTTIGVRRSTVTRSTLPRQMLDVQTPYGVIPVKVSGSGNHRHIKPEFDACVQAAQAAGVPVRVVMQAVLAVSDASS